MKKLMITLLSALALAVAFTGCGGSAGSAQSVPGASNNADTTSEAGSSTVSGDETSVTTPKTPFNLSNQLGTPPGLPS